MLFLSLFSTVPLSTVYLFSCCFCLFSALSLCLQFTFFLVVSVSFQNCPSVYSLPFFLLFLSLFRTVPLSTVYLFSCCFCLFSELSLCPSVYSLPFFLLFLYLFRTVPLSTVYLFSCCFCLFSELSLCLQFTFFLVVSVSFQNYPSVYSLPFFLLFLYLFRTVPLSTVYLFSCCFYLFSALSLCIQFTFFLVVSVSFQHCPSVYSLPFFLLFLSLFSTVPLSTVYLFSCCFCLFSELSLSLQFTFFLVVSVSFQHCPSVYSLPFFLLFLSLFRTVPLSAVYLFSCCFYLFSALSLCIQFTFFLVVSVSFQNCPSVYSLPFFLLFLSLFRTIPLYTVYLFSCCFCLFSELSLCLQFTFFLVVSISFQHCPSVYSLPFFLLFLSLFRTVPLSTVYLFSFCFCLFSELSLCLQFTFFLVVSISFQHCSSVYSLPFFLLFLALFSTVPLYTVYLFSCCFCLFSALSLCLQFTFFLVVSVSFQNCPSVYSLPFFLLFLFLFSTVPLYTVYLFCCCFCLFSELSLCIQFTFFLVVSVSFQNCPSVYSLPFFLVVSVSFQHCPSVYSLPFFLLFLSLFRTVPLSTVYLFSCCFCLFSELSLCLQFTFFLVVSVSFQHCPSVYSLPFFLLFLSLFRTVPLSAVYLFSCCFYLFSALSLCIQFTFFLVVSVSFQNCPSVYSLPFFLLFLSLFRTVPLSTVYLFSCCFCLFSELSLCLQFTFFLVVSISFQHCSSVYSLPFFLLFLALFSTVPLYTVYLFSCCFCLFSALSLCLQFTFFLVVSVSFQNCPSVYSLPFFLLFLFLFSTVPLYTVYLFCCCFCLFSELSLCIQFTFFLVVSVSFQNCPSVYSLPFFLVVSVSFQHCPSVYSLPFFLLFLSLFRTVPLSTVYLFSCCFYLFSTLSLCIQFTFFLVVSSSFQHCPSVYSLPFFLLFLSLFRTVPLSTVYLFSCCFCLFSELSLCLQFTFFLVVSISFQHCSSVYSLPFFLLFLALFSTVPLYTVYLFSCCFCLFSALSLCLQFTFFLVVSVSFQNCPSVYSLPFFLLFLFLFSTVPLYTVYLFCCCFCLFSELSLCIQFTFFLVVSVSFQNCPSVYSLPFFLVVSVSFQHCPSVYSLPFFLLFLSLFRTVPLSTVYLFSCCFYLFSTLSLCIQFTFFLVVSSSFQHCPSVYSLPFFLLFLSLFRTVPLSTVYLFSCCFCLFSELSLCLQFTFFLVVSISFQHCSSVYSLPFFLLFLALFSTVPLYTVYLFSCCFCLFSELSLCLQFTFFLVVSVSFQNYPSVYSLPFFLLFLYLFRTIPLSTVYLFSCCFCIFSELSLCLQKFLGNC